MRLNKDGKRKKYLGSNFINLEERASVIPSLMELTNLLSRLRVVSWSGSKETPLNSDLDRDLKIPTSLFMFVNCRL